MWRVLVMPEAAIELAECQPISKRVSAEDEYNLSHRRAHALRGRRQHGLLVSGDLALELHANRHGVQATAQVTADFAPA